MRYKWIGFYERSDRVGRRESKARTINRIHLNFKIFIMAAFRHHLGGIVLLRLVGGAVEKQLPRGTVTVAVW